MYPLAHREVYDKAVPGWTGRCTAPLLVDRIERRIVSNESSDIVAVLDRLQLPGCTDVTLRPQGESEAKARTSLCEQVCARFFGWAGGGCPCSVVWGGGIHPSLCC